MPNAASRFGRLGWLVLSLLVLVIDQVSKAHFEGSLEMFQQIVVIPDYFSWTLAYNTGAAFSFLADSGGWQRRRWRCSQKRGPVTCPLPLTTSCAVLPAQARYTPPRPTLSQHERKEEWPQAERSEGPRTEGTADRREGPRTGPSPQGPTAQGRGLSDKTSR